MKMRNKRGQSTLEYIILVTAIIAIAIVFLNPRDGQMVKTVNDTYNTVSSGMNTLGQNLKESWDDWD